MNYKKIIILLSIIITPIFLHAQEFEFDDQSGNLEVNKKDFIKVSVILYKDYEYKIAFMPDADIEKIHFRIREDNAGKKILFDNSTAAYVMEKKIILENTTKLLLEVKIADSQSKSEDAVTKGWAALLIEHRRK